MSVNILKTASRTRRVFVFRGTRLVRDDLQVQLSHFVGKGQG